MIHHMRTTLNIEDDVLFAVKQFSRERHESAGHLISELVRKTLRPTSVGRERNGVPMFPAKPGAKVVSMDLVNRLRDGLQRERLRLTINERKHVHAERGAERGELQ